MLLVCLLELKVPPKVSLGSSECLSDPQLWQQKIAICLCISCIYRFNFRTDFPCGPFLCGEHLKTNLAHNYELLLHLISSLIRNRLHNNSTIKHTLVDNVFPIEYTTNSFHILSHSMCRLQRGHHNNFVNLLQYSILLVQNGHVDLNT